MSLGRVAAAVLLTALLAGPAGTQSSPENRSPDCSTAAPSARHLWPPNHELSDVFVLGVTDPDGDPVAIVVTGIAQDESRGTTATAAFCPDAIGVGSDRASLRVERSGQGDGRVYHVRFDAEDGRGGSCSGEVQVCVPHDRRPDGGCVDQGALFDSTAGSPECTSGSCQPEDCGPSADDLSPSACRNDTLPAAVEARVARARDLLERVARAHGGKGRKHGLVAARELRRAARSAQRAAERDDLSDGCAEAVAETLDRAGDCAACTAR